MCTAPWSHPNHGVIKCGQCMECRLAYSREWAIRITHESQMHEHNCFLTLTYDDLHLPQYGQLLKSDLQKFFKRLRHLYRFKYVACGEYGDKRRRPHFHVALFGVDFHHDRIPYSGGYGGEQMFVSKQVSEVWDKSVFPMGHTIGSITFDSAAYIARYITKRVTGIGASPLPLARLDDGELIMPNPEFLSCSKGIGASWFDKFFASDVYPHGRVITAQGTPAPVPRYYKDKLASNALLSLRMRLIGYQHQSTNLSHTTFENQPQRKAARATVARVHSSLFPRDPDKV